MKTKRTLLMLGAVATIAVSMPRVHAIVFPPLLVTDPTGTVRIQQGLPCGDDLDITRRIIGGLISVTPSFIPGGDRAPQVWFNLTKLELFLEPFSVQRKCKGVEANAEFYQIALRLAAGLVVQGEEVGPPGSAKYRFFIPKDDFLLHESIFDNAPVPQPERIYQKPSEDVVGLIDLTEHTIQISVALTSRMHFRAGCAGKRCAIDEEETGSQSADIQGRIALPNADRDRDGVPDVVDTCPATANPTQALDTTPPTVSCTSARRPGGTFQVAAADACGGRVSLRLGPYTIGNGEVIKIEETGKPGVQPAATPNGIRAFHVGKGQAIITATDAAGNSASAACK